MPWVREWFEKPEHVHRFSYYITTTSHGCWSEYQCDECGKRYEISTLSTSNSAKVTVF